jgi:hypothetical protein
MTETKLAPNAVWLFSLATLAVTIGVTYLIPKAVGPITPKAMAAVYFALFGAGATAATYLSRASALRTIGAFGAGGLGLAVFYYVVVARAAAAASALGASSGGASGFAAAAGLVFAIGFGVAALSAGIAGTLFGLKLRKGLSRAPA